MGIWAKLRVWNRRRAGWEFDVKGRKMVGESAGRDWGATGMARRKEQVDGRGAALERHPFESDLIWSTGHWRKCSHSGEGRLLA